MKGSLAPSQMSSTSEVANGTLQLPSATPSDAMVMVYICAKCHEIIQESHLLQADDRYWHEDCLRCHCCDCRLGEVGASLYCKANLLLCKRDYLRMFGSTGYCAACSKIIPAFELVMRARENVYHLECFACQQCNHRFCVGDKFYLVENLIMCESDYEEHMNMVDSVHHQQALMQAQQQQHMMTTPSNAPQLMEEFMIPYPPAPQGLVPQLMGQEQTQVCSTPERTSASSCSSFYLPSTTSTPLPTGHHKSTRPQFLTGSRPFPSGCLQATPPDVCNSTWSSPSRMGITSSGPSQEPQAWTPNYYPLAAPPLPQGSHPNPPYKVPGTKDDSSSGYGTPSPPPSTEK